MISKKVGEVEEEKWETLTDGGEDDTGDGDKNNDDTGDGGESEEGTSDKEKFYPDQDKSPEEIAADKDKEEEGGDKTPEEIEAAKKAEEDKKAEDDKAAKKAEEAGLATAENLKFPEGVPVNEEIKAEFIEISNNKDLSAADRAQALIDLQTKLNMNFHTQRAETWIRQIESDKKFIGSTGDKLDENLALAKNGMESLKVDGLSEYLISSGEGNNPIFVELFMKIGKAISEDTFSKSVGSENKEPKSDAEVLYGVTRK